MIHLNSKHSSFVTLFRTRKNLEDKKHHLNCNSDNHLCILLTYNFNYFNDTTSISHASAFSSCHVFYSLILLSFHGMFYISVSIINMIFPHFSSVIVSLFFFFFMHDTKSLPETESKHK